MKTSPPAAAPTNYHTDGVCVFLTVNLYRDERSPKKWHQDFLWRFDRLIDDGDETANAGSHRRPSEVTKTQTVPFIQQLLQTETHFVIQSVYRFC